MNWILFALALGVLYLFAFVWLLRRNGWKLPALLVGLLHIFFATANSAAPLRSILDDMYLGWQIGLLRFEGRSAALPAGLALAWAVLSAWVCADRSK